METFIKYAGLGFIGYCLAAIIWRSVRFMIFYSHHARIAREARERRFFKDNNL